MIIKTASGNVSINKRSPYGKWIQGWIEGEGFTGAYTLQKAYERAVELKDIGISWQMLGKIMATEQRFGKESK